MPAAALNDPHPTWVSYYSVNPTATEWHHVTTYVLPAHSLVKITIYQFDSQTGLRNPFLGQATGTVGGNFTLNGKPTVAVDPTTASHVFSIRNGGSRCRCRGSPPAPRTPAPTRRAR